MIPISDILNLPIIRKEEEKSRRASTIKKFVEILEASRIESGRKALGAKMYAIKMGHLDQWDLDLFFAQCKNSKNFSSTWWWALKPKK